MSTRSDISAHDPATVSVRVKIAALWTAMLFVFVYVDLFSLYRADVRADIAAGQVSGFTIGQPFLLATTAYVVVPSLMVALSVVLPAGIARITNLAMASIYALTIVGASLGEDNLYYLLGSAVEVVALAGVASYAWTWPKVPVAGPVVPTDAEHRRRTSA